MSEQPAEYITEANEMLGKGYEHPSVEIEASRRVMERRNGIMQEVERPAFVKISTSFKRELPSIDGAALKVWLFISLSINRTTGKANPGLRTIATGVKVSVNTVQKSLQELEELGLLTVDRASRKFNIYETPEYVSANRAEPSVSIRDTDDESVSNSDESVSRKRESVSQLVILNQRNQKNQTSAQIQKIQKAADKTVDAILANEGKTAGKQWTNLPEIFHPFAKVFQDTTGIIYTKKQAFDWMDTIDEWIKSGFQPSDVETAIRAIQDEKRVSISRPGSVTWKLRAGVAAKHSAQPSFEDDPRGVW